MADQKKMPQENEIEEMEEMETSIVELTDEDGVVTEFEYLTTIEHKGAEYVVLMAPAEDDEDDEEGEVVILKIQEDENGEDMYVSCDSDEEAQEVFDLFIEELDAEEEGE